MDAISWFCVLVVWVWIALILSWISFSPKTDIVITMWTVYGMGAWWFITFTGIIYFTRK